jgi:hypothetical protein
MIATAKVELEVIRKTTGGQLAKGGQIALARLYAAQALAVTAAK